MTYMKPSSSSVKGLKVQFSSMQKCCHPNKCSVVFVTFRFANIYKGHGRCSLELEDYEQERVNICRQLSGWMNTLVFTFSIFIFTFSLSVFWLDGHLGFHPTGGAWNHETTSGSFKAHKEQSIWA